MDEKQKQAFEQAVERKKAEAKERSEATGHRRAQGSPVGEEARPGILEDDRPQEETSIRDKSQRHGKVTADKWNQ